MQTPNPRQYIEIVSSKPEENHAEKVNRAVDDICENDGIVLGTVTTPPTNDNKLHWNTVITYTTEFDVTEAEAK